MSLDPMIEIDRRAQAMYVAEHGPSRPWVYAASNTRSMYRVAAMRALDAECCSALRASESGQENTNDQ